MIRVKKRILLIALTLSLLIVFRPSILLTSKKIIFEIILFPVRTVNKLKYSVRLKSAYIRENLSLKEKAALLALEMGRMSSALNENERLRKLLDFKKRLVYKSIAVEVIGRVPSTWTNTILINKGKKNGIKKHMAVCTAEGLVGTVVETGPLTSKVMLITDINSRIAVILKDSRQTGLLVGTKEGGCKVIYLGMDSDIRIGEKVSTSGLGGILPGEIAIGTVHKVENDVIGLYQYAIVKLNQDLNTLEEVICIE